LGGARRSLLAADYPTESVVLWIIQ